MANIFNLFKSGGANSPRSAAKRKQDTEEKLRKLGVPVNKHLPHVDDHQTARFRDSKDVVRRLIILSIIADCIYGFDELTKDSTISTLEDLELWEYVSENERHYLQSDEAGQQLETDLTWRTEAMKVFFWALGFIEKLDLPVETADLTDAHQLSKDRYGSVTDFIRHAKLRDSEEILDETDFIYRVHWAVRQAQLNGVPTPANFNSSVVYERHYALNWLTCYAEEWDDITCDT